MAEDENKRPEGRPSESDSLAKTKLELRDYLDEKIDKMRSGIDAMYHRDMDSFSKDVESHKEEITRQNKKYFLNAMLILAILGLTSVGGYIALFKWVASTTQKALESEIETAREKASQTLDHEVEKIQQQVSSKLDEEFQTERIQSLIENTAEKYTEGRVDEYISQRVDDAIAPVEKELKASIEAADAQLKHINRVIAIFDLYDGASLGSRRAYNFLHLTASLSGQKDSSYALMAQRRIVVLRRNLSLYRSPPRVIIGGLTYEKNGKREGLDDASANFLFGELEDPTLHEDIRHRLMAYILKKDVKEILSEALRMLKESDSLPACAATCGILRRKLGVKAEFLDFAGWAKVCEEELAAISEKEAALENPDSP